jgi:hypothetical protein
MSFLHAQESPTLTWRRNSASWPTEATPFCDAHADLTISGLKVLCRKVTVNTSF